MSSGAINQAIKLQSVEKVTNPFTPMEMRKSRTKNSTILTLSSNIGVRTSMRVVINRFLTLSAQNVSEEVLWALGLVYLILVVVTLGSIACLRSNSGAKMAWAVLVIGLPVLGMALYCLRCLAKADYTFLSQFGIKSGSRKSLSKIATPPRV